MKDYKDLYIVRHGKSISDYGDISDVDRPLKNRGINDSYSMAQRFLNNRKIPDKIISSPAIRALHSATIFARTFNLPHNKILIDEGIYMAGTKFMIDFIKKTENNVKALMIFGHNPTFTELANFFMDNNIDNLPTTGIVGIRFRIDEWSEIDRIKPIESFFDFPKNIH